MPVKQFLGWVALEQVRAEERGEKGAVAQRAIALKEQEGK
jgi:hypothetical protein